ncbi:MAG: alpha-mannosidase [Thermotogota bacterium]
MYEKREALKARIEQRIDEIVSLIIKKRMNVDHWKFAVGDHLYPPAEGWQHCSKNHRWEHTSELPVWFENTFKIPQRTEDEDVLLDAWFGGESLVFVDGKPFGELNPYHQTINLNQFSDSKNHTVSIQVVPHLLFGEKSTKRQFDHSHLLIIDKRIRQFANKLYICLETAFFSENKQFSDSLFLLLEKVLKNVRVARDTECYTTTLMDNPSIRDYIQKKYCSEDLDYSQGQNLSAKLASRINQAEQILTEGLSILKGAFPSNGKISAVGHAHIDYAWLWPISETKRKIPRTFSNAISMCKRYDHFVFAQSSAQMYKDVLEAYPEMMETIQDLFKQGKWEPVGGAWVEHDCNIPSPESLIRQVYYGQHFFKKHFGVYCKVAWLPDVFGFPWTLPQILKSAGMDSFFTTKLTWNEKNPLPHDAMIWRGIDGSEVIYRSFKNEQGYNAVLNPKTLIENWENYREKVTIPLSFITYGYGDGGGGPTDKMMEDYEILRNMPGLPQIEQMTAKEHFEKNLEYLNQIEVWDDELYLEFHRGTYTSQARTKKLHKQAEEALVLLEFLSTILKDPRDYPHDKIDHLWEIVLKNEFHDILPGSSIPQVYQDSERQLSEVCQLIQRYKKNLLKEKSTQSKDYLSLFNPCEYERETTFILDNEPAWLLKTSEGETLMPYRTFDGRYLYHAKKRIQPFTSLTLFKEKIVNPITEIKDQTLNVENRYYKAHITQRGFIQIFDKTTQRYLFKESGNQLRLYEDVPMFWDAWDSAYNYNDYEHNLSVSTIKVIESNELRKVIEVSYHISQSRIVQRYIFDQFDKVVRVENDIDWHHRRMMLKADFETTVLSRRASFDLGVGYIYRNTHKNTDWEKARFEVPGHRWVDISERDFGVGILNDCKYGYSTDQGKISLTLLRSPINPSVFSDEGQHTFNYAITAHPQGDNLPTIKSARELNRPLITYDGNCQLLQNFGFKISTDHLQLMCLKRDKNNRLILRVGEVAGSRGTARISFKGIGITGVYMGNVLEEIQEKIVLDGNDSFRLSYEPFKFYTVIIDEK